MSIDIDILSRKELVELNDRVIERLKYLDTVHAQQAMMTLNIGSRVSFDSPRHGRVFGTVIKFNRKTVVVLTEDRVQWRIPPDILTPIKDVTPKQRFVYANEITQE
ncbi:MAG: hypothetical protein IIB74_05425 [Proteobacteria bacterium]|nr:hypothetical protein [Pseudomonadota bacterium]